MPAFPVTLPQTPTLAGFSLTERESVLRSDPELGPPLTRQRFTAAIQPITLSLKALTLAQREEFKTFFRTDLKGGALTLTWPKLAEHTGGGTPEFQIVAPPTYAPLGRGLWRVSLQLIRLP